MLLLILNPVYPVIASPSPRVILSAANNLTRLRMNSAQQSHSLPRPPGLLQRFALCNEKRTQDCFVAYVPRKHDSVPF